jgi:RNA polymerase sigma-70 factor, ECF subfamily
MMETASHMRTSEASTDAQADARTDAAFAAIYSATRDDLFRYLVVFTGDPEVSAELVSEAFARGLVAWRAGHLTAERPLPWLMLTGRRLATDRWRRLRTALRARRAAQFEHVVVDFDSRVWLSDVCAFLPKRQRELVALRYVRDLSDREIGQVMGLSESGVRSLAARVIEKLRNHPEVWK